LGLAVLAAAAGCLRRTEGIIVHRDGSVSLQVIIEGDPDDVRAGDAMPSPAGGWKVTESTRATRDGKDELVLTASRTVPAGEALPGSFAPPDSPEARTALAFPTTVRVEHRDDGTYYHFRRVYRARPAARIMFIRKQLLESDDVKELMQLDPAELTEADRKTYVDHIIAFEKERTTVLLDQAAASMGDAVAAHQWLPARLAARRPYDDEALSARTIAVITEKADVGAKLEQIERDLSSRVERAIRASLQEAGVASAVANRFLAEYRRARTDFEVTEDLGDEEWRVVVEMPGVIIAKNGVEDMQGEGEPAAAGEPSAEGLFEQLQASAFEPRPNRAGWVFRGDELLDYDYVLLATSFVAGR
jgi:hypothetical protein